MRSSKFGLRALGLSILAALSMMAFAASAQAQLPGESKLGEFQINLAAATAGATIHGKQEGTGSLLVPGRNLTIDCTSGLVTNGKINGATDALATALFEGCTAWNLSLTTQLQCTVLSPGEATGKVGATALALPILHGGVNYVLFEPDNTLNFAEVELHGEKCPLPLVNPVKGSIVAEVVTNDVKQPLIKFAQAIQELSGDKLTFGGFPSYIDATAHVELTGPNAGSNLGVV